MLKGLTTSIRDALDSLSAMDQDEYSEDIIAAINAVSKAYEDKPITINLNINLSSDADSPVALSKFKQSVTDAMSQLASDG